MYIPINTYIKVIIIITFTVLLFSACRNYSEKDKYVDDYGRKSSSLETSIVPPHYVTYHSLNADKFQDILNDNQLISSAMVAFGAYTNYDQYNHYHKVKLLGLEFLQPSYGNEYSAGNVYEGSYDYYFDENLPYPHKISAEREFLASDVNEHIMSYLSEHADYFFDGSEYTQVGQDPYVSSKMYIITGNYVFAMMFGIPDMEDHYWAITKASDNPDPILQGLINILESEFIAPFHE
jgi:hypothetical protein